MSSNRRRIKRSDSVLRQKLLHPQKKTQRAAWQHKNATTNFDNTTIADRLQPPWGDHKGEGGGGYKTKGSII